jgi:hypothetical protein
MQLITEIQVSALNVAIQGCFNFASPLRRHVDDRKFETASVCGIKVACCT